MFRKTLLLLLSLCCTTFAFAQRDAIMAYKQAGLQLYEQEDFEGAIKKFEIAKYLVGVERRDSLDELIIQAMYANTILLEKARDRFSRLARAGELAGQAYSMAKINPTVALWIARHAVEVDPGSKSAQRQLHDILNTFPAPFYSRRIELPDYAAAVAFAPDGRHLITASWDSLARIYRPDGSLENTLSGHQDAVVSVAFSPDGKYILTGSHDDTAILWQRDGKRLHTLRGHEADVVDLAFSPQGDLIATASWDGSIRLWNLQGEEIRRIEGHDDFITSVAFSADGQRLATGSWDHTAKIWSVDGELLTILKGHTAPVADLSFSPDGTQLLTGSWDRLAMLWDLNGALQQTFRGHTEALSAVAFSPDGDYILTGGNDMQIHLWDRYAKIVQTYQGHTSWITDIGFSPDGEYMVSTAYDQNTLLWRRSGFGQRNTQLPGEGSVQSLAVHPTDGSMVIGYADGRVRLTTADGTIRKDIHDHGSDITCVAWAADGQHFLSAGRDDKVIVYTKDGQLLTTYSEHRGIVTSAAFFPDGKRIVSASYDRSIKIWDLSGQTLHTAVGHGSYIYALAIRPDGQQIITGSRDRNAVVWNNEGEILDTLAGHRGVVSAVCFSPDGQYMATTIAGSKSPVFIWNQAGKRIATLDGHAAQIWQLQFSPDGQYLLTGSNDNTLKLWDLEGNELQTFQGHENNITALQWSPTGDLISVSYDGNLRTWLLRDAYLASDKVIRLTPAEKEKYDLPLTDTETRSLAETPPRARASRRPDLAILAKQISIEERGQIGDVYHQSLYFSSKTHLSDQPAERILLQRRSIQHCEEYMADLAKKFPKEQLAKGYGTAAYLDANLAIWLLADNQDEEALTYAKRATEYYVAKEMKQLTQAKYAIVLYVQGEKEEAQKLWEEVKGTDLNQYQFNFPNLHQLLTTHELSKVYLIEDAMLADLDYLLAHNPQKKALFTELRNLIRTSP